MDIKLKSPWLGAVLVGSAAIGAQLGESAIADINPLYFQGPAVHPRDRGAAVDEAAPVQTASFADAYGWAEGQAARLADCGDCTALAARDRFAGAFVHHAAVETFADPPAERADAPLAPEREFVIEVAPEVERYAYYPIEQAPEGKPEDAAIVFASAEE